MVRAFNAAKHVPYPAADVGTLQLLGTIDALLKAPPRPPRWALLRVLSLLEEYREMGPEPAAAPEEAAEAEQAAAKAVARRVQQTMRRGGDSQAQEPDSRQPPNALIPSNHRRVREERDVRGVNGLRIGT